MHLRTLAGLAFLAACTPFNQHPGKGWTTDYGELWSPTQMVTTGDALYIPMPYTNRLLKLGQGSDAWEEVPLLRSTLDRVVASPDGETVLVQMSGLDCPEDVTTCADDEVSTWLGIVGDSAVRAWLPYSPAYDDLTFSADGRFAVATVDPDYTTVNTGLLNLTAVKVIDLVEATSWDVGVGFSTEEILFTTDDAGAVDGAVVLSRNEVAVVDLTVPSALPSVVFPLTLDADSALLPVGVELTPDGTTALITVQNSADLYALDLVNPSVNIISLVGAPSDMAVSTGNDQTVLVYGSRSKVEVLDHGSFDLETRDLEEPMTDIHLGDDFAFLYSRAGRLDTYRLDLVSGDLDEIRLAFPPARTFVAPDNTFALMLNNDTFAPRMELVDLRVDAGALISDDPVPFGLEGRGLDVAFTTNETGSTALLLQQGVDALVAVSFPELALVEVPLPAPARRIGAFSDGGFWIAHDDAAGLISFYRPGEDLVSVGGFALHGFLNDNNVPLEVR